MRQTAMYLAHVAFGLTYTQIGQLFSRDRTTVAHACSAVEERRDDPVIDRALTTLEEALRLYAMIAPEARPSSFPRS
jgi:chromosomal replication initiation ATPase DnaA